MHRLTTGLVLVGICVVLLALCTYGLLRYYREKSVSFGYSLTIYITWFLGFIGMILYPVDIGYSIADKAANPKIKLIWVGVYWFTFFLAWVYIPIMMEYWASGEFKPSSRFKESLWVNAKFYVNLVPLIVVIVIWYLIAKKGDTSGVQGLIIALSNTYGLLFVIFLLGPGLVELPINLWRRRDQHRALEALYQKAYKLDAAKYEYEYKVVSLKMNLQDLQKTIISAKKSPRIQTIISDMILSMPSDEAINLRRHSAGVIDKSEWLVIPLLDCVNMTDAKLIDRLSAMNSKLKKTCLVYERKINQYEECIDSILSLKADLNETVTDANGQSLPFQIDRSKPGRVFHTFWLRIRSVCLGLTSVVCGCLSIAILLTELTTLGFPFWKKSLSIIGAPLHHIHNNSMLRTFMSAVPLTYLFICFFRSFFLLRIPFVESYHLYYHHTDVYALSFNAYYLCRLQYSLCYHYFTLLQMDEQAYESIALSSLLGEMKTIPFLGSEFNFYVPAIVFLVSVFTFGKMMWPAKKKADTLLDSGVDEVKAGQELVVLTLKRRAREVLNVEVTTMPSVYSYQSPVVSHSG
ncbi:hypothetical protein WA577_000360, partial [Blastocystis sp. JDR]